MSYLEEFKVCLANNDLSKFQLLWEEYSQDDKVDVVEFKQLLEAIKSSESAKFFGGMIESALPLWKKIENSDESYEILRLLIDLQTTNSAVLGEEANTALQNKYNEDPHFKDRMRLIGMRTRENFQGALSNYQLLAHIAPGKFVFHTGGWGVGEIVELSAVREQLVIEFELVGGRKDMSFENAFKTLLPIPDDHFLAKRFGNPDLLEKEARNNPLEVIHLLLRDLGPKTAAEIKDELAEWVIPEKDWTKWWQAARAKIKKDTMIETPETLKQPFVLRRAGLSHEERFEKEMHGQKEIDEIILTTYNYVRDFPHILKKEDIKQSIISKLTVLLNEEGLKPSQEFKIYIFLESHLNHNLPNKSVKEFLSRPEIAKNIQEVINDIDIIAFKKRALIFLQEHAENWAETFLFLLDVMQQSPLRDFIVTQLNQENTAALLKKKVEDLLHHPQSNPDLFNWYFQEIMEKDNLPYANKEGQCIFLEAFLILFNKLENQPEHRDQVKKMYNMLSGKRYALVRKIIEDSSLDFIKEFLLLASKCQTFTDHDIKILRSLAEVAHPSLVGDKSKRSKIDPHVIWTTEEGYLKTQERIRHLGTVEVVENAREIEAARALGDLRENAEYKSALEKRSRLQRELKELSDLFHKARVITEHDIVTDEVSIGAIINVSDKNGNVSTYTILGPWDADPENNILSFQSRLAQSMIGCKKGDLFHFRDEEYVINEIHSYLR